MTLNINAVEAFWIITNLLALIVTVGALIDATADRTAVRTFSDVAANITAKGVVRRERFRVIVQLLMLSVVIPGILSDVMVAHGLGSGDPPFTIATVALVAIPIVLLLSSLSDIRERRRLRVIVTADVLEEQATALERIEVAIAENTKISQAASDLADAAYKEANAVNEKIASNAEAIVDLSEARATDSARVEATVDDTHEKVIDIHSATLPKQQ